MVVMEEEQRNRVLLVGSSFAGKEDFVQQLVGGKERSKYIEKEHEIEIVSFVDTLETKYYSAELEFLLVDNKDFYAKKEELFQTHQKHFGDLCEAIILISDSTEESETQVKLWERFIDEFSPPVMIYVDTREEYVPTTVSERMERWAFNHGIEVIPLAPQEGREVDFETNAFPERFGIDRVREALETNMWSHMSYKSELRPSSDPEQTEPLYSTLLDDAQQAISNLAFAEKSRMAPVANSQVKNNTTEALLNIDEPFYEEDETFSEKEMEQLESFEEALVQLSSLRRGAKELPDEERRAFAAQVALSFLSHLESDEED